MEAAERKRVQQKSWVHLRQTEREGERERERERVIGKEGVYGQVNVQALLHPKP